MRRAPAPLAAVRTQPRALRRGLFLALLVALQLPFLSRGAATQTPLSVAVAANFLGTVKALASLYERQHGTRLTISAGSTGQLYAQIKAGAPYDVFLSADDQRTRLLEEEGLGVKGSRFVYAYGKLVLWSPKPGAIDHAAGLLRQKELRHVGIADPRTAPYGAAAKQVLKRLGLFEPFASQKKLVIGASIAQTYQFVRTGSAECGFVALSQVLTSQGTIPGSVWRVPRDLYSPIAQEAILLSRSKEQAAAKQFLLFLRRDPKALSLISAAGYAVKAES